LCTKAKQAGGTTCDPFLRFVTTASSLTRRIKGWRDRREGRIKRFPNKLYRSSAMKLCIEKRTRRVKWQLEGRMFQMHRVTKRTENRSLLFDMFLELFRTPSGWTIKCISLLFRSQHQNANKYAYFLFIPKIYGIFTRIFENDVKTIKEHNSDSVIYLEKDEVIGNTMETSNLLWDFLLDGLHKYYFHKCNQDVCIQRKHFIHITYLWKYLVMWSQTMNIVYKQVNSNTRLFDFTFLEF